MSDPPLLQRVTWTRGVRRRTDKDVLSALVRWYAWRPDGTSISPSTTELAAKSQIPLRSVERALQRLVQEGWLQVVRRRNRGRATYRLVVDRLAMADPDRMHLATGPPGGSSAKVADERGFVRQSGGRETNEDAENRPVFEKVADEHFAPSCYVPRSSREDSTGYTHTPASPFHHPNHTYCGARFCVPAFLDAQFRQQLGGGRAADLQAWYRALNAQVLAADTPIGDALKWLRARFADWVCARTAAASPPRQLSFGPLARESRRAVRHLIQQPSNEVHQRAFEEQQRRRRTGGDS